MSELTAIESDFAAVMQELSAQAASPAALKAGLADAAGISILISAVHSLGQRIEALEESFLGKFEQLHFQKIEEQLNAMRESESVNQKLFDTLHEELLSYRDNFVRESLQKPFIRDLLVLFDDLSAIARQLETAETKRGKAADSQSRANLDNAVHFLLEILHRFEVSELEAKETIDRTLHRVISVEPTDCAEDDGKIVKRLKCGFTWHGRVLRPEEVIAKRFG